MARIAKAYRALWGLSKNPFPDHAIAAAGDVAQPFYESLHPGIDARMAQAFLGPDGSERKVAFLWSLGHGDEARGYGKTRHLLWFTERVNQDFGESAGKLAGRDGHAKRLLATYAAFSTIDGLSLSNLLFDVVLNLARSEGRLLMALRAAEFDRGRTPKNIYEAATRRLRKSQQEWFPGLLKSLSSYEPTDWIAFLDRFRQWHKVRYGRGLLRTSVALLKEIGIDRLLILVDQVEDFASFSTPSYKLQRDFHRLALLCSQDPILSDHLTFVLTMHPRAARILCPYWSESELGPVSADENAENVVLLRPMNKSGFKELVRTYLDSARTEPTRDLKPFKEDAIEFVHEIERGRPGHALQRLFFVMDSAAAESVKYIARSFVEHCLAEDPAP